MILPILLIGDKRLRSKSAPVKQEAVNAEFHQLVVDMFATMYAAPGVGLAAVQVGVLQRFMVLDIAYKSETDQPAQKDPKVIINPQIIQAEGDITWEEGCLSCPDISVEMQRKKKIVVKYRDLQWQEIELTAEDLLSVAIQHEMDHMDGKLIVDNLSPLKREMYIKQLKRDGKGPVVR